MGKRISIKMFYLQIIIVTFVSLIIKSPLLFFFLFGIVHLELIFWYLEVEKLEDKVLIGIKALKRSKSVVIPLILHIILSIVYSQWYMSVVLIDLIIILLLSLKSMELQIYNDGIYFKGRFYPWSLLEEKVIVKNYNSTYEIHINRFNKMTVDAEVISYLKNVG